MSSELVVLLLSAVSIGFFHTLLGPDHYLPFIVMSRSGQWSLRKTTLVTALCGIGHVVSSIGLGLVGVAFGIAVVKLEAFESFRGNIAAWALIAFGLVYFVWGLRKALRNRPHKHSHAHESGLEHEHTHVHQQGHVHAHAEKGRKTVTPWVLFVIFILGPCEPLIPLLMYPAAQMSLTGMVLVSIVFGLVTIGTMLGIVLISIHGFELIPISRFERYMHAVAGATILLCGITVQFLGL